MALKTRTVSKAAAEGGDAKVEEFLDSKAMRWEFKRAIDTDDFDVEKSLRNQARFVPVDEHRVDTYAEAMRRGDKFPPVVAHTVRGKLVIVDGNHRLQAAIKARRKLDVYDVTGADARLLTQVSYEANTKHGWPTSEAERITQALWLIDSGTPTPQAAAALMVPVSALKRASAKRGVDQRFRSAGVPAILIEKLPESTKLRLAQVHTDEGFTALVQLVADAGLDQQTAHAMVTEINEFRRADAQVRYVETQREVYAENIAQTGGGLLTRPPRGPKARISMAIGGLMNLPDDTEMILSLYHGAERDEAAKKMRAAARVLNDLAKQLVHTG